MAEMNVATGLAATMTSILGFAAGLLSFKVKSRWCRRCGQTMTCPECSKPEARSITIAGAERELSSGDRLPMGRHCDG